MRSRQLRFAMGCASPYPRAGLLVVDAEKMEIWGRVSARLFSACVSLGCAPLFVGRGKTNCVLAAWSMLAGNFQSFASARSHRYVVQAIYRTREAMTAMFPRPGFCSTLGSPSDRSRTRGEGNGLPDHRCSQADPQHRRRD